MEENLWNEFELKKSPLVTVEVTNTAFAKEVFVAISRYLQKLTEPSGVEFEQTAALIGRLMARRKSSFRTMIGFRSLCKLNSALCRLLRIDLSRELESFRGALPDVCDFELAGALPTKSNFEYILVRLLSVYHLHRRIRDCCVASVEYFSQLLRNNFFMDILTLLIAAISKIYKLSAILANHCVKLYNTLIPQQLKFPHVQKHKVLPADYELPRHLELIKSMHHEEQNANPVLIKAPTVITKIEREKQKAKSDVGTVVSRVPEAINKFDMSTLISVDDIKQFIKRESKSRENSPTTCITKAVLKHEWLAAQTLFERKLRSKEHEKAINIFRKFISSKI